jgi:hypothetical protein
VERYRKVVGDWKDIEIIFYINDSSNDDLEGELKTLGDAFRSSNIVIF